MLLLCEHGKKEVCFSLVFSCASILYTSDLEYVKRRIVQLDPCTLITSILKETFFCFRSKRTKLVLALRTLGSHTVFWRSCGMIRWGDLITYYVEITDVQLHNITIRSVLRLSNTRRYVFKLQHRADLTDLSVNTAFSDVIYLYLSWD